MNPHSLTVITGLLDQWYMKAGEVKEDLTDDEYDRLLGLLAALDMAMTGADVFEIEEALGVKLS